MKKYILNERDLKELVWAAEIVNVIELALPTGLEGFEEEVSEPEDIDLSDFEQL